MSLSSIPVLQPESNLTAVPVGAGDAAWQLGSRTATAGDGTETDPEAVQESAFPGGSSGSRPASASAREAMQAPRMPVLSRFGEHQRGKVYEFPQTNSGAVGETSPTVSRPQNIPSVLCPQDVRKGCMIGTVVIVIFVPLALLLCYVFVRQRSKSKEHAPAPWGHRLETSGYPLRSVSPTSHPGIAGSWDQRQQLQPPPETPARPPSRRDSLPPPPPPPPTPLAPSPTLAASVPQNGPSSPKPQPRRPPRPPRPQVQPSDEG
ncbi:T-cell surface antigen CD2-like isoform X2 [Tyto alba]|uniref:T-cell surface antigen CD2-like isoform X2 n=1 Tax=Tyto alba TaxID=56313 RepID=UPI001C683A41|nr:T-cell surface antigen CD2-like isoform X2 [Tyto alba]